MYIAFEGVIGVGKTTLARLLQPFFDSELLLEVFEENPFLSDFYSDRARYAFQTQIFFLLSRYRQQRDTLRAVLGRGKTLISDYTFAKDALFARINLRGDELEMYGSRWTRAGVLQSLVRHQIHHRGQATVLMRQAGLAVPGVYGPAREEWAKMGMPAMR